MYNFSTYLWAFLFLFISGKMHSINSFESKTFSKHQQKEIKNAQEITGNTGDENSPIKRKIKKRGLPTAVPQIEDIPFLNVLIYKKFRPGYTEDVSTSFLYCVSLKRGPPLV